MGSGSVPYTNKNLVMVISAIENEVHSISNIISNAQILKTGIAVGTGEINPQSWILTVATWVTDILLVLYFISK